MKLSVIALDYDGTIASDNALEPAVRQAIADARARRIVVVIVTGRRLDDLRQAAGDVHFVDAIVAENGAVLHFPATGYTSVLAPAPPPALLEELAARGIPHVAGQCLVEAAAADAPAILDAVRARELPIALAFNRSRLMLLPQSVSKATGLREALAILRLSPHSAVAIGDAENDHELLRVCEVGVAVSWGSRSLRAAADLVIDGKGPPAVATFLASLARTGRMPVVPVRRRRLFLGHTDDGAPFTLAVQGRNVLVAGDARSGKSWVAGLLAEQLILQRYSVCVIDPEGDYRPLEHLPGVVVLGGADPLPRPRELIRALRHAEASVVLDLSRLTHREKVDYVSALLPALVTLRQRTGLPHRIVMDEAHYFLHDESAVSLLDLERNGYTLATYRASHLPAEVMRASEVVIVTSESDPEEVVALHAACSRNGTDRAEDWMPVLGALRIGEAAALPITEEAGNALRRIHLAPRLTHHVRHREKYVDIPVPESRGFVFTRRGRPSGTCTRTLREFVKALETEPPGGLEAHMRAGDFSRWIRDVFGDYPLAATVHHIEDRCGAEQYPNAVGAVASTIRGRYDLADERILVGGVAARGGHAAPPPPADERPPAAGGR
jgi:hydroxymethylpyrimidine pyrophosphatase-like HAD family hydrolase